MNSSSRPLPNLVDEPYARRFWEAAGEEILMLQFCPSCREHQFFPRPWCQFCGREDLDWKPAEGTGTVYSFTVVRRTIKNPEFDPDLPYVLILCELEEGPRMFSMLVDCDPDEVSVGMPVEVTFQHRTPEVIVPMFRPARES